MYRHCCAWQYTELAAVYNQYEKQGFTVLGFPCNQFGKQEPGSNATIKQFAQKVGVCMCVG